MNPFKNRIVSNASWVIGLKMIQAVLTLVINALTARFLGPSNFGLISYAASLVAFVVPVMQLGFSDTLVQELTNHSEEEGKIVGTAVTLSVLSSLFCIGGVTAYTFAADANESVTHLVVILYSVLLIFQAFELIQYWFQAKLLSKYMSIASLSAYVVVAIYKIILLVNGANIYWFAVSNALDYLLIALLLFLIYAKLGGGRFAFSGAVARRMLSSSKHYIVAGMMVTIFAQTDKIMLKLMIDETAVGFYSAAVSSVTMTGFVFVAIMDSFRPVILEKKKENDTEAYEKNIERLYCIIVYLSLLQSVVMTVFAPLVIGILYGTDYQPAVLALRIIVWYATFSYIGAIRNIWILGEGKHRFLWIVNLGGALLNVAMNFILIPVWGIYGAAAASLATQIFANIFMSFLIPPLRHNNRLLLKGLNPMLIFGVLKKSEDTKQ